MSTHGKGADDLVSDHEVATTDSPDADAVPDGMSEYELTRARNIVRNNARLRSLGLISALEEQQSNNAAWGRRSVVPKTNGRIREDMRSGGEEEEEWVDPVHPSGRERKRKKKTLEAPVEGPRKSLRLRGIGADGNDVALALPVESPEERAERIERERAERVEECREIRLRAAKAVAEAGAERAARENPTATYEHCLMRVRTMSEKGLANRVKAIERAAGRHCVVKMAIFKSCLQDEDMWGLAEVASEALERLKGLQPLAE